MFVKYFQAQGCTADHILAIKAEVIYRKDSTPRGYYLSVAPVDRERHLISAKENMPEQVFWSEAIRLSWPSKRILLKEVARKSSKAETEAIKDAESMIDSLAKDVAQQIGWALNGKEGLTC